VILEETLEGAEGAEAVVLLKVSEKEDQVIIQRQKAMLQKGFEQLRGSHLDLWS